MNKKHVIGPDIRLERLRLKGNGLGGLFSFLSKFEQILAFFKGNRCSFGGVEFELDSSHGARMLSALKPDYSIRRMSKENRTIRGAIHEHFSP
jgi:hypothetical protein